MIYTQKQQKIIIDSLIKLRELQKDGDTESAHNQADLILCKILESFNLQNVVEEYNKIKKWYA